MTDGSKQLSINQIATPILAVAAMTALCFFASSLLVPIVSAATLSYILWPAISLLKRWKVPHILAVVAVLLIAIVILLTIGMLIYTEAKSFAQNVPEYWKRFQTMRVEHAEKLPKAFNVLFGGEADSLLNKINIEQLASIPKYFLKGVGSALSFFGQMMLVILLTLFMLIEQPGFRRRFVRVFGSEKISATTTIIAQVSTQIVGYLWVRFVVTVGLAIIFTVGLLIGGIDYAYVWGPLAALLNLIPYVGSYIGAVPPMIMSFIQFNSLLPILWVFLFFMAVQFVESNLISPRLIGEQLNINLLSQLISTIYWGWLWGAVGIILAVPITATFKVICDHIEALHPIGVLLSGDKT